MSLEKDRRNHRIRELYMDPNRKITQIAREMGVSRFVVRNAISDMPPRRKKYTYVDEEMKANIRSDYEAGMLVTELQEKYNISHTTLYHYLGDVEGRYKVVDEYEKGRIVRLNYEGVPRKEIAEQLGLKYSTVNAVLQRENPGNSLIRGPRQYIKQKYSEEIYTQRVHHNVPAKVLAEKYDVHVGYIQRIVREFKKQLHEQLSS